MIKLPVQVSMWLLYLAIKIPVALSGSVMVAIIYFYRNTPYDRLPFWTKPWANPEDWMGRGNMIAGSLPKWWFIKEGSGFKSWYHYHAIRNPANGMRSYEFFDLTIDPNEMEFVRSSNFSERRYDVSAVRNAGLKYVWFYAWQGLQAGFEFIYIWHGAYTRTRKHINAVGKWWQVWKWEVVEIMKVYPARHLNIKLGWRIEPSDKEYFVDNMGTQDASFASKILPYREG